MPGNDLAAIIAERTLTLDGEPSVVVRIAKPELDDETTYVCRYEIAGLAYPGPCRIYGADSVQALLLALHLIAIVVETSPEAEAGRLGPRDRFGDLGLRYPDDAAIRRRNAVARSGAGVAPAAAHAGGDGPTSEAAGVFEALDAWSRMTDDELRAVASPETVAVLRRAIDELLDDSVFVAVDRSNFPHIVRLLSAANRDGARALGNAIVEAGEHERRGRAADFANVMRRFIERSPTRFHREIGQDYLKGRRLDGT